MSKQGLNDMEEGALLPAGIHTLADISNLGRERTTCPYFTIRRMVSDFAVLNSCLHSKNIDAVRRCSYLFLPLSFGSQSCRTGIERTFKGRYSCV